MNRRRDDSNWNPGATQELAERARSSTDRHEIDRIRSQISEQNTAGISELMKRVAVLETTMRNVAWLIGIAIALGGVLLGARHG